MSVDTYIALVNQVIAAGCAALCLVFLISVYMLRATMKKRELHFSLLLALFFAASAINRFVFSLVLSHNLYVLAGVDGKQWLILLDAASRTVLAVAVWVMVGYAAWRVGK